MKPRHANSPSHAHWSRPNTKYEKWFDSKRHLYLPYDYDNDDDGGGGGGSGGIDDEGGAAT